MNNKDRAPLIRIAKRSDAVLAPYKVWGIRLASLVIALVIGGIIFAALGADPFKAYGIIVSSSFAKSLGRRQVLKGMVPLLGTALALAPCFKMRYWNCGGEGQITMGAMAASWFALFMVDKLPAPVLLLVMGVSGAVVGGLWSAIPALFRARYGTNETLFTLMLNYIAIGIVAWLQGGPWEGKPGSQLIPQFKNKALLPKILGVHCGWVIVLLLVFVMFVYLNYTKHGYEISVLGESENTARYAGMNVGRVTVRTAFLSGAICGLVGFMLASGTNGSLQATIANGAGFTGITIAWLAQLNPFAMVAISLMMAVLAKGSGNVQTSMGIPSSISGIITGIILMSMLACEFFVNYQVFFRRGKEEGR
ncbi:MAG: ABC transporter permease [Firmicutes bacterium]|nr:ABC transporter permease [Bacillota bacterium]